MLYPDRLVFPKKLNTNLIKVVMLFEISKILSKIKFEEIIRKKNPPPKKKYYLFWFSLGYQGFDRESDCYFSK